MHLLIIRSNKTFTQILKIIENTFWYFIFYLGEKDVTSNCAYNRSILTCSVFTSDAPRYGAGSETPMHPSRTPLHPYMTPMRDPGGVLVCPVFV